MRTKMTAWYDKEKDRPLFGIKVFVKGCWANLAENGEALLFETEKECEAKRKEVRRWQHDDRMTEAFLHVATEAAEAT